MERAKLLNDLTALDFMAVDLHLYLDTHPDDDEAIEKYNEIIREADSVRYEYERAYGPLCGFRSLSSDENFTWIDSPWPWQSSFNYNLEEAR